MDDRLNSCMASLDLGLTIQASHTALSTNFDVLCFIFLNRLHVFKIYLRSFVPGGPIHQLFGKHKIKCN